MHTVESTIASLAERGEQLAAKRVAAQDALDKAITARQQARLAGDLDDQRALDKLQGSVDTAASTLAGLDDALAILEQQKAETGKISVTVVLPPRTAIASGVARHSDSVARPAMPRASARASSAAATGPSSGPTQSLDGSGRPLEPWSGGTPVRPRWAPPEPVKCSAPAASGILRVASASSRLVLSDRP
jgi:hypothetical protein